MLKKKNCLQLFHVEAMFKNKFFSVIHANPSWHSVRLSKHISNSIKRPEKLTTILVQAIRITSSIIYSFPRYTTNNKLRNYLKISNWKLLSLIFYYTCHNSASILTDITSAWSILYVEEIKRLAHQYNKSLPRHTSWTWKKKHSVII